jgi:FkbM family methyltransferase
LQENIKLNQLKNIIPINLGVSSKKEKLCFYMPETMTSTAKIVSCSTNKDVIEIETTSIDEFIHKTKINPLKITLIKIDVEGHEFEVLKGMKKLLKMLPNDIKIICEILEDKNINLILKFMKKLGYIHKVLETQTDYLFYKFP